MSAADRSDETQPQIGPDEQDPIRSRFGVAGVGLPGDDADDDDHDDRDLDDDQGVVAPGPGDKVVATIPGSGLSEKTIKAAGIFWSGDAANRERLGWPENRPGSAAGIVIPYLNVPGYAKVRFDDPPAVSGQSTKPIRGGPHGEDWTTPKVRHQRYGSPAGATSHIYVPPRELCPLFDNDEEWLIITEGEKKALLVMQEGHPAIALPGVFNWHDAEARRVGWDQGGDQRRLHPELASLLSYPRCIALCFDAPDMDGENREVHRQAVMLAKTLVGAGHEVMVMYVPHQGGEKTGIDDYLMGEMNKGRQGLQAIWDLLCDASSVVPSEAVDELLWSRSKGRDVVPMQVTRLLRWATDWIGPGKALRAFAHSLVSKKLIAAEEVSRVLQLVETTRDRSGPTEFPALCEIFRNEKKRAIACGRQGVLEMDSRTHEVCIDRVPFGSDTDISGARERIARTLRPLGHTGRFDFRQREITDALMSVAAEHEFHPVQEYLKGLKWDGHPRIRQLQKDVMRLTAGPHTALNDMILRRWFVSAVARALNPGCKVDTVLILQGKQGVKKSSFFSTLAEPWFSDSPVDIDNKDGMMVLGRSWILEWPELESMSRARDQTTVKAFISSRKDVFRPPYGRTLVEVPRSSIFVGTTNEDEFLTDETGNRRYWPIGGCNEVFDLNLLQTWRDQLWAEAVHAHVAGEQWWLTDEEAALLDERLKDYERRDPWDEPILTLVAGKNEVTTAALLKSLNVGIEFQNRTAQMRVAACLKRNGFERGPRTKEGTRSWVRRG